MASKNQESLLRRMQDLLANMTPANQDAFLAELNISANGTLEPLAKDATTFIDLNQPKPPNPTPARARGLFAAAYQDASLFQEHLHIIANFDPGNTRAAIAFAKIHLLPVDERPCYLVCTRQPKPTLRVLHSAVLYQKILLTPSLYNKKIFAFGGDCVE